MNASEFGKLIDKFRPSCITQINYKIKDEDISNDIFQESSLKAWKAIENEKFEGSDKDFRNWLSRICSNATIDYFRRDKFDFVRDTDDHNVFDIIKNHPSTEDDGENEIFLERLNSIEPWLSQIDPKLGSVLYRHYFEKKQFKDIAKEDNTNINTTLGRARYALINIRKLINIKSNIERNDIKKPKEFVKIKSTSIVFTKDQTIKPIMEKVYNQEQLNAEIKKAKLQGIRIGLNSKLDPSLVFESVLDVIGLDIEEDTVYKTDFTLKNYFQERNKEITRIKEDIKIHKDVYGPSKAKEVFEEQNSKAIKTFFDKTSPEEEKPKAPAGFLVLIRLFNNNTLQTYSINQIMEILKAKRDTVGQYVYILKGLGYINALGKGWYKRGIKPIPETIRPIAPKKQIELASDFQTKEEKTNEKEIITGEPFDEEKTTFTAVIELFNEYPLVMFTLDGICKKVLYPVDGIKKYLEYLLNEEFLTFQHGFYKRAFFPIPSNLKRPK